MSQQVVSSNTTTPGLYAKLLTDSAKLGPITQFQMFWAAAPYMFRGISEAGARSVIAAVDRQQQATVAQMTCTLVKLGYVDMVADMTIAIVEAGRADVVAKVSIEAMLSGELDSLARITQRMMEKGHPDSAACICKAMADHGHQEFMKLIAKENLPEPMQQAKEAVESAVQWVTGSKPAGERSAPAEGEGAVHKVMDQAKERQDQERENYDGEREEKGKLESQSAPGKLTTASIA